MGSHRKNKSSSKSKAKRAKSRQRVVGATRASPAPAVATAAALPSPEEVVGAVLEAVTAPLLETIDEWSGDSHQEESASDRSGIHALSQHGSEHRAHPRVVVEVAVGLETESHFFAGLSGDVSEGGVFVQTYRDLPIGSAVDVQFDLPETRLRAHGRVRWHREKSDSSPPGVGIAFDELNAEDRRAIQQFCEKREPLYYDVEHADAGNA